MKKTTIFLLSLFAILAIGSGLRAQEVTVEMQPGWNWISYPYALDTELDDAFGDFEPMEGDIIKTRSGFSLYLNGTWRGGVSQFVPSRGYMYYSSRNEPVNFVFAQASTIEVVTDTPTNITALNFVAGGMVTQLEDCHVFLRGICWGTSPLPDINGFHTTDGTGAGSFSGTLWGVYPNTTYYVRAYAVTEYGLLYGNEVSFTTPDGNGTTVHEYVDLGLPSGTLWATCNVGAESPEDYGDYFAWAEIQPKSVYNWNTYQYCTGSNTNLTKYCINSSYGYNGYNDLLFNLLPEDDAATSNWGYDWRLPTKEEWNELIQNTTHTWVTQNGVNGQLFTASNGNSIFLPACGYRSNALLYTDGINGFYWSSSLDIVRSNMGWYFCFNSCTYVVDHFYRSYGCCVRPVHSGYQK